MTITELKGIINEQIGPAEVKKILTLGKESVKSTEDLMITYPQPGYQGVGTLIGKEEFMWSFVYDGKDWLFSSELLTK